VCLSVPHQELHPVPPVSVNFLSPSLDFMMLVLSCSLDLCSCPHHHLLEGTAVTLAVSCWAGLSVPSILVSVPNKLNLRSTERSAESSDTEEGALPTSVQLIF
jgi:hypothetical protein